MKLEEEEIEMWYEEHKQKLSELYIKSIEKGMPLEKREAKFTRAMDRLNEQYKRYHTRMLRKKENAKKRKESMSRMTAPFRTAGRAAVKSFSFLGGAAKKASKAKCANLHFQMSMIWIKSGYKIADYIRRWARPPYYLYVKHIQPSLIALTAPFKRLGRNISRYAELAKEGIKNTAKQAWERVKKAVKWAAKHTTEVYKKFTEKAEAVQKRYTEWQKRRVQAYIERKQDKKERKENKLKEKNPKEEGPAKGQEQEQKQEQEESAEKT